LLELKGFQDGSNEEDPKGMIDIALLLGMKKKMTRI